MNLQAKLTLGYVLLATLMVAVISAVDLGNVMKLQFDATLERAETLRTVAADQVKSALNRQLTTAAARGPARSGAGLAVPRTSCWPRTPSWKWPWWIRTERRDPAGQHAGPPGRARAALRGFPAAGDAIELGARSRACYGTTRIITSFRSRSARATRPCWTCAW